MKVYYLQIIFFPFPKLKKFANFLFYLEIFTVLNDNIAQFRLEHLFVCLSDAIISHFLIIVVTTITIDGSSFEPDTNTVSANKIQHNKKKNLFALFTFAPIVT